ncbi:MAG TPA: hypothetical protein VHD85_09155 [Terracidiphilus sp.]|nr:hypothetical protein [Terracidiphilus sp.]
MPSVIAAFAVVLLVTAVVFQFLKKLRLACWTLFAFPVVLSIAGLLSLIKDPAVVGATAFRANGNVLVFCIGLIGLCILAVLRPGWRWLFWMAWLPSAFICGALVYLVFFWNVFS